MANPKASATTQSYRQSIKSTNAQGQPVTTTFFQSNRTPAVPSQGRGGGGGSSTSATALGGSVELFLVGAFFIWVIESGKLQAIIAAAKS